MTALWVATVTSVLGTLALIHIPEVVGYLGRSLAWFVKVPTLVYLAALPAVVWLLLQEEVGPARAGALLLWGGAVGLGAELLGTTTGLPFGAYHYTDFLGPKILGHVPVFVPLSWFAMAMVAVWLAATVTRRTGWRIAFAASAMVGWDLALDPAMVAGWPVWVWADPAGIYYGMPLLNLAGWWLTSAIIVAGYLTIVDLPASARRRRPVYLWLLSAALPLGLIVVQGLWPAAVLGSVGVVLPVLVVWVVQRSRIPGARSRPRAVASVAPVTPARS